MEGSSLSLPTHELPAACTAYATLIGHKLDHAVPEHQVPACIAPVYPCQATDSNTPTHLDIAACSPFSCPNDCLAAPRGDGGGGEARGDNWAGSCRVGIGSGRGGADQGELLVGSDFKYM